MMTTSRRHLSTRSLHQHGKDCLVAESANYEKWPMKNLSRRRLQIGARRSGSLRLPKQRLENLRDHRRPRLPTPPLLLVDPFRVRVVVVAVAGLPLQSLQPHRAVVVAVLLLQRLHRAVPRQRRRLLQRQHRAVPRQLRRRRGAILRINLRLMKTCASKSSLLALGACIRSTRTGGRTDRGLKTTTRGCGARGALRTVTRFRAGGL